MLIKYRHNTDPSRRGFTLIELAMVLVLVSLMTGFALQATQGSGDLECYASTRTQMAAIHKAMDQFVSSHNRYPAPAGSGLGVTDPNVGREYVGGSIANAGLYFGALPFQALGLPSSYAADCWGNKFTYIVTQALVDSTNFTDSNISGSITVYSGSLATHSTITTSGAYAVISHGAEALGAFKRNYIGAPDHTLCNVKQASGAILRIDKENCDTNNNVIYVAPFNNGNGADLNPSFFDDLVLYNEKPAGLRCTLPWDPGTSIASGASVTAYNDNTCDSVQRTCNGGTLGGDVTYNKGTPTACQDWYFGWVNIRFRDGTPIVGNNWASCNTGTVLRVPLSLPDPGCVNSAWNCPSGDYSGTYPGGARTWWCPIWDVDHVSGPGKDVEEQCVTQHVPFDCSVSYPIVP